ncbi:MAG: UPF0175 family protein [Candidatus Diapherotrites archaeon]
MPVDAFSLPKVMKEEIFALVSSGHYSSKSEVIKDAFRNLLRMHPELRTVIAVELFKNKKISIGRASEIAGLNIAEFKQKLKDRGIKRLTKGKKAREIDEKLKEVFT